jgi:hypothetical protein
MLLKEFTTETLPQGTLRGQAGYCRPFLSFHLKSGQVIVNKVASRKLPIKPNDFIAIGFDECSGNWYFYQHEKGFMLTKHYGGLGFSHKELCNKISKHFNVKPENTKPFRLYLAGEPTILDGKPYWGLIHINKD